MPRIPYPDLDNATPEVREMLGRLPAPANIFNMMAHAQTCLKPVMKLGGTLLGKLELDPKLRELCLLRAVRLEGGDYEWVQHVPIARDLGATAAQIAALENDDDEALYQELCRFLDDPALCARLGAQCREYVEKHLSWPLVVSRHLDFYSRVAAHPGP